MVQNSSPKPRGRPRAYDPEVALARATDAFWRSGFGATSLDDLAAATGMNRPSLYAAFGDKHALYATALARYAEAGRQRLAGRLAGTRPLREELAAAFAGAIALYTEGPAPRGCFAIGTAAVEAVDDPAIRDTLAGLLRELDAILAARFRAAREAGELPEGASPEALGALAGATLHSLALRARAGAPPEALAALAEAAVALLCGAPATSP